MIDHRIFTTMDNLFSAIGFSAKDVFICVLCISMSIFGSLIDYVLRRDDWDNYPQAEPIPLSVGRNVALFFGRVLVLGSAAGLATWLMLYGSMNETASSYCKLMLLSGFAGFSAPDIAKRLRNKKFPIHF